MDLTDAQWAVLEPLFRPKRRADGRGRPWQDTRAVLNGVFWVLRTGAPWHDLPSRYPSYQTCHRRFQHWQGSGLLMRLLQKLAEDLQDRGKLDLSESFIDASFSGAKKGALVSALQTATDGLGRTVTSTTEDGSGTVKSIVSSNYDLIGRAYQTSNPYTGTPSYGTTQFDVLGRPISVTAPAPDASVTSFTYTNQYVTVTDPAGKQRKTQSDAAGRLASTFEPDINNSNQLTQQTSFTYTVLFLPRAIARNARSAA